MDIVERKDKKSYFFFFRFAALAANIAALISSLFLVLWELDLLFFPNPIPVSLFDICSIIHYLDAESYIFIYITFY